MQRASSTRKQELTNVAAVVGSQPVSTPSPEAIRARAYEIYIANGAKLGRDAEDWTQAERELRAQRSVVTR